MALNSSNVCNCSLTEANNLTLAIFNTSSNDRISYWVDQPSYRGTWDILWTCLATISICTYTLLCLNVPAPHDSWLILARRRILWVFLAIIAPEIVLAYASGQRNRALQSVEAFHNAEFDQWDMRKAFFADMGGFVLCSSDCESFPLNAVQLHWLITNQQVEYPNIETEEIWDKSKQDRLSKLIASIQIGYFILQCIGRVAQHLAITTLELNTLAIVACSVVTSFLWLHKPSDVHRPLHLHCKTSIKEIAGLRTWNQTPLDFVDENRPGWSMNIQPFMKMPVIAPQRPIQRLPNDRFPMEPPGFQVYLLCFGTLSYTGIHIAGWKVSFPSSIESTLWRVSSLILFGVMVAFWILEKAASLQRHGNWTWLYLRLTDSKKLPDFEKQRTEKLKHRAAELSTLPLPWEFWSLLPIALCYGIARGYLLVEAFLELRSLKSTAYLNVQWSTYIPHI